MWHSQRIRRAFVGTLGSLLLTAASGCSNWYDGIWRGDVGYLVLEITDPNATLTIKGDGQFGQPAPTLSTWNGDVSETDSGIVLRLRCSSAWDPITEQSFDCSENRLEMSCKQDEDNDRQMNCPLEGKAILFVRDLD